MYFTLSLYYLDVYGSYKIQRTIYKKKNIFTRMKKDILKQMVTMLESNPQPPEDEANVIPLANKMDHFDILYKTFAP